MWEKTPEEQAFYARMFQLADIQKNGKVEGKTAVDFFTKSGLPAIVLKQVWSLASTNMQPYLNQEEFNVALGLIALAQVGEHLDLAKLASYGKSHKLPLPVFNINGAKDFVMAAADEDKYKMLFRDAVGDIHGTMSATAAMDLFQKSGMPLNELQEIYNLVDTSKKQALHIEGFIIAMHLIVCKTRRGMGQLPSSVPMELFPTLVLPEITLESVSSGGSASGMLQKQLNAQKQLQEAYARIPAHSAALDAELNAVEALGYNIPPSARGTPGDATSLQELESIMQRYITQVQDEIQALQQDKGNAPVSVQTLLQTLTNLKQQSTRLTEQKEAILRSRHPNLHIDVGKSDSNVGGGFNASFEATSFDEAIPVTAPGWSKPDDFPQDFAPAIASSAPSFVAEPNMSLFSPSNEATSFGFDVGSAGGTGGSTSFEMTAPPLIPDTSKKTLTMNAFAIANDASFNALEAMNEMDLNVSEKYLKENEPVELKREFSRRGSTADDQVKTEKVPAKPLQAPTKEAFADFSTRISTTSTKSVEATPNFFHEAPTNAEPFPAPTTFETFGAPTSQETSFATSFGSNFDDFNASSATEPASDFGQFNTPQTFGEFDSSFDTQPSTNESFGAFESSFDNPQPSMNEGFVAFGDFKDTPSTKHSDTSFGAFVSPVESTKAKEADTSFGTIESSHPSSSCGDFQAPTSSPHFGFSANFDNAPSDFGFSADFGNAPSPNDGISDFNQSFTTSSSTNFESSDATKAEVTNRTASGSIPTDDWQSTDFKQDTEKSSQSMFPIPADSSANSDFVESFIKTEANVGQLEATTPTENMAQSLSTWSNGGDFGAFNNPNDPIQQSQEFTQTAFVSEPIHLSSSFSSTADQQSAVPTSHEEVVEDEFEIIQKTEGTPSPFATIQSTPETTSTTELSSNAEACSSTEPTFGSFHDVSAHKEESSTPAPASSSSDFDFGSFDALSIKDTPTTTSSSFPIAGGEDASKTIFEGFGDFTSTQPATQSSAQPPSTANDDIFGDFQFADFSRNYSSDTTHGGSGEKHEHHFSSVPANPSDMFADFADFQSSLNTTPSWDIAPTKQENKSSADFEF
ncbi:endocytosis defective- protein [Aphanomyces cochlioides]|nr:endocytosis defective- protein [Aphanomyces cochlioides]